jgi:hypothetical protein
MRVGFSVLILLTTFARTALAQTASTSLRSSPAGTVDWFLNTAGPGWDSTTSRHFAVHLERPVRANGVARMVDSLEAAWVASVDLLHSAVADEPRVHVFVTASRTRFGPAVGLEAKGLTTHLPDGSYVVVLVQNDSVRAYARHEVMHVVSSRAWGTPSSAWLNEGLATFADGRCQGTTIIAVGRDLLAARPGSTATELLTNFIPLWRSERATAYVLAGTFVDYLWSTRGRAGMYRLWRGTDSLEDVSILPGAGGPLTARWHAHVRIHPGDAKGVPLTSFQRLGCG